MIIISQDRDTSINLQKKLNTENIGIQLYMGNIIGYNLNIDGLLMGTFDTIIEVWDEINNINNCEYEYYIINGFTDYLKCF